MLKYSIEKASATFRENLGYSVLHPIEFKSLLMELKVLTIFKKMEGSFSGMSLKIDDNKFMLVNSSHSIGRQNFTILHELYHLIVQKEFTHTICDDIHNKEEDNANIFAINLLLPREGVLKKIPDPELKKDKITLNTILEIEQYYSSSRAALLNRLLDLKLISEEYKEAFSHNVKENALLNGFDTSLYDPGNENLVIGDYGKKARMFYEKEIISKTHYIELMRDLGFDIENNPLLGNE